MSNAKGFKYIVAARDDLTGGAEGCALRKSNARAISQFVFEEILCRYGAVGQITTDNGPEVQAAFSQLMDQYKIPHVKTSAYNSKAN